MYFDIQDIYWGGEDVVKERLSYRYSRDNVETLQVCDNSLCIQAVMPSSNQVNFN